MMRRVTPMIHVPDVRATIDWYKSLDFNVVNNCSQTSKVPPCGRSPLNLASKFRPFDLAGRKTAYSFVWQEMPVGIFS